MEINNRRNSLRQQLAGALSFTEIPPLEMKNKAFISSHDSRESLNLSEDLLFGASFRIPSRPQSETLLIPKRRVVREQIPPVTPSKIESQVESEKKAQEANQGQRKQKRKRYKPKVVDDGTSGKTSRKSPGNSNFHTKSWKDTDANPPATPDLKHQCPRQPIMTEPKRANHEASITCESKPASTEAFISIDPMPQVKRAQIAPHLNLEVHMSPELTCMDSGAAVPPNPKLENIRFYNAADSKTESLEAPITPDIKSDLKPLNVPGLIQFFVREKGGHHINKDQNTRNTEQSLEKSSIGIQLNSEAGVKPEKSVRRQLNFGCLEYYTDMVSSEEINAVTNNLNKSTIAINHSDDVLKQLQPFPEGLNSGPEVENELVTNEENTSVTTQRPESSIGTIARLNCHDVVKPVQLVANGLDSDLQDRMDAVMHGEMQVGNVSSLNQAEMEKAKCPMEDIDRIGLKDHLIHLTARCLKGVTRRRPKQLPKLTFDDMLNEIVLKMTNMNLNENALVLYQEKKLKYRGIVALDEDSLIEWNTLMGENNCGPNSAPGLNPDREEKWRKERDTFRNLAEWFIAKMKLIQGDRCFSEWKGSVVDSVVGAFLTQNVNDQLSSSAFISLCARFPQRQDGDVTRTEKKFPDIKGIKSHILNEPNCMDDIVDPHNEGRPQKVPKDNTPLELAKEGTRCPKVKTANVPKNKGYKIGMEDIDWDGLRKEASRLGYTREGKTIKTEDAADWDAVRQADTSEVAKAIHGRGQDNVLAERIQNFLNRVVKDHGSMDLEWLRETPGDQAKEYLLSIFGLGLKSVECVRLLALHQVAFPVDTNVGRISVRLGWVPLQPLPESVQIHLLELYPVMDSIQKYLWPRLCKLDQETLYELHYQMITFGKVFCTKSKPNCNACPLRSDCKHFASAFASARLMLPEPKQNQENKVVLWNGNPNASNPVSKPTYVATPQFGAPPCSANSEPIIEEPLTPEEEQVVEDIPDIEDICFDDPDEIPTINLNMESFVRNVEELVKKNDSELQVEDISKALVLLPPIAASIPPPKLKHSRHLRTVHEAYELPDGHPILRRLEFEERDSADPSPYLLILSPPEKEVADCKPCHCNSCNEANSCDFLSKEDESRYVKCSFMIPCRTAMRGSFPLNGTYFQVNEVFADHCTARKPVMVPRDEIWRLRTRPIYFGSTVSSILKGLPTEEIQYCFWRGFVCVREFDRVTRYPRPLSSWLHLVSTMKKKIRMMQ